MAYSHYCTQGNRYLCFSMVLSSALLTQRPVGRNQRLGTKQRKQCNRIPKWQERCVQGEVWLGVRGRASLLAAFISWVWKFHWACPVDGVGDARRLGLASSLEFSIPKHLWACPSLGFACWRPFCQFLHPFHRVQFLPSVSVCQQSSGMVCCFFIIARNLSPFNRIWMVPLYHPRLYNNNCLSIMAASTIV